jgi:hypothetical protein
MLQVINNENVNCLALTSLVKAGQVSDVCCGTYKEWLKQGWSFYFELRDDKLYSIMSGSFPHGEEYRYTETDEFIAKIVRQLTQQF